MFFIVIVQGFLLTVVLTASRNDVYVEVIKTVGIIVSACASLAAVVMATRAQRELARIEGKVDIRRREVRAEDTPGDEPPRVIIREERRRTWRG